MHRVHFDTGSGALCGTRAVVGWTTRAAHVTCARCLARLARAAQADGGQYTLGDAHGALSGAETRGDLSAAAQ